MPILDVQFVGDIPTTPSLARALADAAGKSLQARPGGTWVKLGHVRAEHYAESDGGPADGVEPIFVTVLERTVPTGAALADRIRHLTRAIAATCGRPEQTVHVRYEPPAAGRQAFGGTLVD